jgi:hypothetical protein
VAVVRGSRLGRRNQREGGVKGCVGVLCICMPICLDWPTVCVCVCVSECPSAQTDQSTCQPTSLFHSGIQFAGGGTWTQNGNVAISATTSSGGKWRRRWVVVGGSVLKTEIKERDCLKQEKGAQWQWQRGAHVGMDECTVGL